MKETTKKKIYDFFAKVIVRSAPFLPTKRLILFESNPNFSDNTYPLYAEMVRRGYNKKYKMIWLLNNGSCPEELPKNVSVIRRVGGTMFERNIRQHWAIARARIIFDSNVYVYKTNPRTKRIHLRHALGLKDASAYYHSSGNADVICMPTEYWIDVTAKEHGVDPVHIKLLGFPRNDLLIPQPHEQKAVIWMPTYRIHKAVAKTHARENDWYTKMMPFGLPCVENARQLEALNELFASADAMLYIRLHPAQDMSKIRSETLSNICLCDDAFLEQNGVQLYEFLCRTDALITDYSSIYYDYLRLEKPIAMVTADFDRYTQWTGLLINDYKQYREAYPAVYVNTFDELTAFLRDVLNGKDSKKAERMQAEAKYIGVPYENAVSKILRYLKDECHVDV